MIITNYTIIIDIIIHLQYVIPTFAGIQYIIMQNTPAKVGITSCRCATENALLEAVHAYMALSYNSTHYRQVHRCSCDWFKLATCFFTFYCDPYFLSQVEVLVYSYYL